MAADKYEAIFTKEIPKTEKVLEDVKLTTFREWVFFYLYAFLLFVGVPLILISIIAIIVLFFKYG